MRGVEKEIFFLRCLVLKGKKSESVVVVGVLILREVFGLVWIFKLKKFELSLFKYRRERFICKEMVENIEKRADNIKFKVFEKVGEEGN